MNRQELIEIVAAESGQSQRVVDKMLTALVNTIQGTVADGDRVALMGFGTFEAKLQPRRVARNVVTGDPMEIPATVKPRFKPGVHFRKAVADGHPHSTPEAV